MSLLRQIANQDLFCAISSDGGKTWTFDRIAPADTWRNPTRGFGIANDRLIALDQSYYGGGNTRFRSKAIGELGIPDPQGEWDAAESYQQKTIGDMLSSHFYSGPDGYTYFQYNPDAGLQYFIYRRPSKDAIDDWIGQKPYEVGAPKSGATWVGPLNKQAHGDDGAETLSISPSGHMVLLGTTTWIGTSSHMYLGRKIQH